MLTDTKHEVASPEMIRDLPQFAQLANKFEPIHPTAEMMLLIGRNNNRALKTKSYGRHTVRSPHSSWQEPGGRSL